MGSKGCIRDVDANGDVHVYFPALEWRNPYRQWMLRSNFKHLAIKGASVAETPWSLLSASSGDARDDMEADMPTS